MGRYISSSVIASYDKNGNLVKIYKTAKSASLDLNVFIRSIDKAIRLETSLKGYRWKRYLNSDEVLEHIEIDEIEKRNLEKVKVAKLDENNEVKEIYFSISEASKKNNISSKQIRECLKGHQHKAGGHYWKRID